MVPTSTASVRSTSAIGRDTFVVRHALTRSTRQTSAKATSLCCSPVPHHGLHRGRRPSRPSSPPWLHPSRPSPPLWLPPSEAIPASVAATHRGRPRLHVHCPSRMLLEHSIGRRPCRGRAGRPVMTV
jgi:hypothetical protein